METIVEAESVAEAGAGAGVGADIFDTLESELEPELQKIGPLRKACFTFYKLFVTIPSCVSKKFVCSIHKLQIPIQIKLQV
jgi:hypothetical protein